MPQHISGCLGGHAPRPAEPGSVHAPRPRGPQAVSISTPPLQTSAQQANTTTPCMQAPLSRPPLRTTTHMRACKRLQASPGRVTRANPGPSILVHDQAVSLYTTNSIAGQQGNQRSNFQQSRSRHSPAGTGTTAPRVSTGCSMHSWRTTAAAYKAKALCTAMQHAPSHALCIQGGSRSRMKLLSQPKSQRRRRGGCLHPGR
jgi:hypothetical protein